MYKNTTASRLQHQFNAGSINVRTATCDAKCEEVIAREADRANLTICGLQETRRLKKGEVILNIPGKKSQYMFHWSAWISKKKGVRCWRTHEKVTIYTTRERQLPRP